MKKKIKLTLIIKHHRWRYRLSPCKKTVQEIINAAAAAIENSLPLNGEVAVVLADDSFVQELNCNYRGKDKPTNVLSFPSGDFSDSLQSQSLSINLGDIIIAFETVLKESIEQNKSFREHCTHLLIHGFLHLLGYDHEDGCEAEQMEGMEIKILRNLGINNPYTHHQQGHSLAQGK